MRKVVFLALLLLVVPAFGQSSEEADSKETTAQAENTRPAETSTVEGLRERIRRATRSSRKLTTRQ